VSDVETRQDGTYRYTMEAPVSVPPRRVVSLVPSVTESLFELGVGGRLIAITDYCAHPADQVGRLPRIGGTKNPDVARIIALQPDLVIANQEENRQADALALQAAGIPVWVTFPKTVRDAFNLLWNIMYVFDEPSMVERIRSAEWLCDWLERMEQPECRVFAPIWYEPLMTFNADTFAHDLLRVCGGMNVFAGREARYPQVTLAEVEAAQPDVILLPSEPFAFDESHLPAFAALNVPAARHGRIRLVDGSLLTWHGTRIARALNALPNLLCSADSET
jgi:ABC-type Fe3+-hydroxamate transport system substrate-binding protein